MFQNVRGVDHIELIVELSESILTRTGCLVLIVDIVYCLHVDTLLTPL